ncbi:alpha/beta hydrolase [Saccharopolyspora hirsuta]|uniref:alpha/beta hydrolase n=1 Tax=Saccharopolyspora hirsuta TaxID=1837 RepID=UPI0036A93E70
MLILQNLRDPATPLAGAQELRKAFGSRARMVTADQGGHLAYLFLNNQCVHAIATNFLVNGDRPSPEHTCEA